MSLEYKLNEPICPSIFFPLLFRTTKSKFVIRNEHGHEIVSDYSNRLNNLIQQINYKSIDDDSIGLMSIASIEAQAVIYLVVEEDSAFTLGTQPVPVIPTAMYRIALVKVDLHYCTNDSTICYIEPLVRHLFPVCLGSDLYTTLIEKTQKGPDALYPHYSFGVLNIQGKDSLKFTELLASISIVDAVGFTTGLNSLLFEIFGCLETSRSFDIQNLNFETWYTAVYHLVQRHVKVHLDDEFIKYLKSNTMNLPSSISCIKYEKVESDSDFSSYCEEEELHQLDDFPSIQQIQEAIKDNGAVIPHYCGTFLDDAMWILNKTMTCRCTRDVVLLLKASTTWQESGLDDKFLILFRDSDLANGMLFKLFIYQSKLVAISQLLLNQVFDFLSDNVKSKAVCDNIINFFECKLKNHMNNFSSNYTVDIIYKDKIKVLYILPWGCFGDNFSLLSYTRIHEMVIFNCKISDDFEKFNDVVFALSTSKTQVTRHDKHCWCPQDIEALSTTVNDVIDAQVLVDKIRNFHDNEFQ